MKTTKVEKAIGLITSFTKAEVKEFVDKMALEHSVYITIAVPLAKTGGFTNGDSLMLKESKK